MKKDQKIKPLVQFINKLLVEIFTLYFRLKHYLFDKDYYNNHYLSVKFEGWKLTLSWSDHESYVQDREDSLNKLQKKLSAKEFIAEALILCNKCNFLIFECKNKNEFVQFWLGDGKIIGSWTMSKNNNLKKYSYAMLGVLNELGITKYFINESNKSKKLNHCYYFNKYKDFDEYSIEFGNDVEMASKFTEIILTEVFKDKLKYLKFNVG